MRHRLIRHPIYLGVIVGCMGIPVYASSWRGLAIVSALIPVFLDRIRIEERMLSEGFRDAYRRYREATSKLIPFVH